MFLGLDIGSVTCKAVLIDEAFRIIETAEARCGGNSADAVVRVVDRIFSSVRESSILIGVTGCGCESFEWPPGVARVNDIVALALGASKYCPDARSVIEIGGQTSCWLRLKDKVSADRDIEILDFAINERCAAGSGAFLEQQASRLKLDIQEFSSLAASADRGSTVAGRCSVFAKSDMIHLQQKGTPVREIAYGICLALARNFVATILKGQPSDLPLILTGGAVKNKGLVRAFREILDIDEKNMIIASDPLVTSATGAAMFAQRSGETVDAKGFCRFVKDLRPKEKKRRIVLPPLSGIEVRETAEPAPLPGEIVEGFLGVDVGSVSTNFAVIDIRGNIKVGVYLPTKGRPLEVLKEGFEALLEKCNGHLSILGVGTTGSGRYLAGKILQADAIHNEITCQLITASRYFPEVDTIFEIGGQDSKFISVKDGQIVDFTMNKICAAGTGSFLEEQADQLGINIEQKFSSLAAQSSRPYDLGSRCTVFMDTELVNALSRGVSIPNICAGLAYSIVRNYLEKVVADRSIGDHVVFQGGVASNPAVVRAFSHWLGQKIDVHPHNRISGAIGAALIAQRAKDVRERTDSLTEGLKKRIKQPYTVRSFQCQQCSNRCEVNCISMADEKIYFGDTCERYTSQKSMDEPPTPVSSVQSGTSCPKDFFSEREHLLSCLVQDKIPSSLTIGLPRASYLIEYLPFWTTFFHHLGYSVEVSPPSNSEMFANGLQKLSAEACLPVKIAYGHAQWLLDRGVDKVIFPSPVNLHKDSPHSLHRCPYTEHLPFMVKSAMESNVLTPCVDIHSGIKDFLEGMGSIKDMLHTNFLRMERAFYLAYQAQNDFAEKIKAMGRQAVKDISAGQEIKWIVLGKPYNIHDRFLNLNLSKHLQRIEVQAIPQDFIPLDEETFDTIPGLPPWDYNRKMIQVALWCRSKTDIYPVILSNFGCGPDAFVMRHLNKILEHKPNLFLEFDEHRGEAGLITRLEAFWDEVKASQKKRPRRISVARLPKKEDISFEEIKKKKFVLPNFADHAVAFSGAFKGVGLNAEVLPLPDGESQNLGEQYSSGKECHAYSILVGDLVKYARSKREGEEVFYFPGSKHTCLLNQYGIAMRYLLHDLGIDDLEVISPPMDFLFKLLGNSGLKLLWRGLVAVDLLIKGICERRPYERQTGQCDEIHGKNLSDIEKGLSGGNLDLYLERCVQRLGQIDTCPYPRPLIGIAGDIYTRINPRANHGLFQKLEDLGCEVWPAPFLVDQLDFGTQKTLYNSLKDYRLFESVVIGLLSVKKEFETWRIKRSLRNVLPGYTEPGFVEIVENSAPYIGYDNNDLLILNISKMVDFAKHGADGVINAICFNCMLGTISGAIATRIRRDFEDIPIPTLVFSGSDLASEKTKLEAFVYQVQQHAKRRLGTPKLTPRFT
ncbi:MAG: acyl-CoA dehydratase activase [Candidatus Aminicenantes bacterium]|jgi:predicted CoA-substrate-specific enzyme activase